MSLTNEDLLAISQLLDKKLKSELQPINNKLDIMDDKIHKINLFQENIILPRKREVLL